MAVSEYKQSCGEPYLPEPGHNDSKVWLGFLDLCATVAPPPFAREVRWEQVDWDLVIRLAQEHKLDPAVWRSIEHVATVPNAIKAYFHVVRDQNFRRNSAIMDCLATVLVRLNEIGIKVVLLKGAASIADGLYADPAERFLSDIDLLIEADRTRECVAALRGMGFTDLHPYSKISWIAPRAHHLPPLVAPSGTFCIELHTSLVQKRFERMLPSPDILRRASAVNWHGLTVHLPDPTDRIVHNIVHMQLHHDLSSEGLLELRQLRELAYLMARYSSKIDWDDINQRFLAAGHSDVLSEQITFCRSLLGVTCPIPERASDVAMKRLKTAVSNPVGPEDTGWADLKKLIRDYAFFFRGNPTLIINLINPFWWPSRLRLVLSLLKRNQDRQIK